MFKIQFKKILIKINIFIFKDIFRIKDLILWKVFNYEKLRYNIKLNKSSIVFDGGGFDGEYSSVFNKKYKCKIFIFEPLPEFCRKIELRFKTNV